MRISIFGHTGMLGVDLVKELEGHEVARMNCDITKVSSMYSLLVNSSPELVIHLAAMTNVDECEKNPSEAARVNIEGTSNVAAACSYLNVPIVYVSTDMVFNGDGCKLFGFCEKSIPNPKNVYGMTKLLGEKVVQSRCEKHYILRTAWLYGKHKNNYVDYYRNSDGAAVVPISTSNPTSTVALSRMIVKLLAANAPYGIYNAVCTGWVSKKEVANYLNPGIDCQNPSEVAPRPYRTPLYNTKLAAVIGEIPTWEQALEEYLNESR